MKKSTKVVIWLILFFVCLIVLALGIDFGSMGCTTASLIGIVAEMISGIYIMIDD